MVGSGVLAKSLLASTTKLAYISVFFQVELPITASLLIISCFHYVLVILSRFSFFFGFLSLDTFKMSILRPETNRITKNFFRKKLF